MANCNSCSGCSGDCSGCSGCSRDLTLTQKEIDLILLLGQIPFLPVARTAADPAPVPLIEELAWEEDASLIVQCLEKKSLIALDYDQPLKGFSGYGSFPLKGSMALTERGHTVLELLERQGIDG